MATISDPIRDLFGSLPFSRIQSALEPVLEDLFWALEPHLGQDVADRIRVCPQPVKELLFVVRRRKDNPALVAEFRSLVLQLDELRPYLAPDYQRRFNVSATFESENRRFGMRFSPQSGPNLALQANLLRLANLGWRKITKVVELEHEMNVIDENGHSTVVVFSDEMQKPLSADCCEKLRNLAFRYRNNSRVRFAYVDVNSIDRSALDRRLEITPPTTLIICNGGCWKTLGEDVDGIAENIRRSIDDLDSVKEYARQVFPRPPFGWSVTRGIRLWRNLPEAVEGIILASRMKRDLRPHLVHVLPLIKDKAPHAYQPIATEIVGTCGSFARKGETIYTCFTCQPDRSTMVDICPQCFDPSDHVDHQFERRTTIKHDIFCDCGAMAAGKLVGIRCKKHKQERAEAESERRRSNGSTSGVQDALRETVFRAMLLND
ncbi:hypothetical protein BKA62DRAFT_36650 [Auriculariales sp. MPI-PUGE-AT-0066]|nr:hypothetical protein BKA62DRAFT_36650 [Auriculariales sp. MPI-PUGE-AT-0066]